MWQLRQYRQVVVCPLHSARVPQLIQRPFVELAVLLVGREAPVLRGEHALEQAEVEGPASATRNVQKVVERGRRVFFSVMHSFNALGLRRGRGRGRRGGGGGGLLVF